MEKYGPKVKDIREFNHYDTFRGKVKLLVIMAKECLGDCTLQGNRQNAIAKNVAEVAKICEDWNQYSSWVKSTSRSNEVFELDHILYQRISLLSTMTKSVGLGIPIGNLRKKVIRDNISYIVDALQFNPREEITSYKKVA